MSSFWDSQKELKRITKNKKDEVVVCECTRQGKTYLDFRIYTKTESEEYVPTSKGFNLEKDKAIELIKDIINII